MEKNNLEIDRDFFSSYFHDLFNSLNTIGGNSEPYEDSDGIEKDDLIDDLANIHEGFNTALLQSQKFKIVNNPKDRFYENCISSVQIEKEVSMHFPLLPKKVSFKFNHKTDRDYPNLLVPLVHSIFYLCLHQSNGQLVSDQTITCKSLPSSVVITASNNNHTEYLINALDHKNNETIKVSSMSFELMFLRFCLSVYSIKVKVTNKKKLQLSLDFPELKE